MLAQRTKGGEGARVAVGTTRCGGVSTSVALNYLKLIGEAQLWLDFDAWPCAW